MLAPFLIEVIPQATALKSHLGKRVVKRFLLLLVTECGSAPPRRRSSRIRTRACGPLAFSPCRCRGWFGEMCSRILKTCSVLSGAPSLAASASAVKAVPGAGFERGGDLQLEGNDAAGGLLAGLDAGLMVGVDADERRSTRSGRRARRARWSMPIERSEARPRRAG